MTYLLIAFLVAVVTPLFIATWRASLLGLAVQGLLMSAILLERGWPTTLSGAVLLADLLVLRTAFTPRFLYRILRAQGAPRRSDPIPANLLSWATAGALVFAAFQLSARLCPEGGDEAIHVAVAAAALLVAFLVLAAQERRVFGQVAGALRLENAIALFELAAAHEQPLPVQLGLTLVYLLSVLAFGAFIRRAATVAVAAAQTPVPAPARGEGRVA